MNSEVLAVFFIVLSLIVDGGRGTLSKSDRKVSSGKSKKKSNSSQDTTKPAQPTSGPVEQSVYERSLVTTNLRRPSEVVLNHDKYYR